MHDFRTFLTERYLTIEEVQVASRKYLKSLVNKVVDMRKARTMPPYEYYVVFAHERDGVRLAANDRNPYPGGITLTVANFMRYVQDGIIVVTQQQAPPRMTTDEWRNRKDS